MSIEDVLGNKLLRFEGEAGQNEIVYTDLIRTRVRDHIEIDRVPLNEFFHKEFHIPDYQRGYEWDTEQWDEFWAEIIPLLESNGRSVSRRGSDVFFGSMFFSDRKDINRDGHVFDVIDGQQRVTTLSVLFKIIADHLVENLPDCGSRFISQYSGHVGKTQSLIYTNGDPTLGPSLELDQHNREFFSALMRGEEALIRYIIQNEGVSNNTKNNAIRIKTFLDEFDLEHDAYLDAIADDSLYEETDGSRPNLMKSHAGMPSGKDDASDFTDLQKEILINGKVKFKNSNNQIRKAYRFFSKRIDGELENRPNPEKQYLFLVNLKEFILQCFYVGYFEVDDNQPQLLMKIFEVLNNRGVELKQTDIIRTRIIGRLRRDASEREYDEYTRRWESVVDEFDTDHRRILDFLKTYFVVTEDGINARGDIGDHLLEAFTLEETEDDSRRLSTHLSNIDDAKELIEDLQEYAVYYHHLVDPENYGIDLGEEGDQDTESECNRILIRLSKANTSVWQPLVLAAYHDVCEHHMDRQGDLLELLRTVESMTVRLYVSRDVHVKDNSYAAAVGEFTDNGFSEEVKQQLVREARSENSQLFGEPLVKLLCESDWRPDMGKQLLRKLVSEAMVGDDEMVLKTLNEDDEVVHIEHIFPQSPLLENHGDKYDWYRWFFCTENAPQRDDGDYTLQGVVEGLIDQEADDHLGELAEKYIHSLGNLTLLRFTENQSIGNLPFAKKAYAYDKTDGFDELSVNESLYNQYIDTPEFSELDEYMRLAETLEEVGEDTYGSTVTELGFDSVSSYEEFVESVESRMEELANVADDYNRRWTYEGVTERKIEILEQVATSIQLLDNEYGGEDEDDNEDEEINYREIVETEAKRQETVITANFQRFLD
ncbi:MULTISPECIES: DUF262 domain-containing protein [Haloferax]|uniref:DUF262 domain-containing protein n=2 Tax=Haloferax TaxID=2251 RepID=A0A6G1Z7A7_9EURY|nr:MULTISPECIES: DUF262 domain-containing protein [Haloferax]KAB1184805.1 DUF262 domain-containing protein [Haloferax sp. CBA1149]MRW82436.1 DUF262 domain-containing protein [Haloferax marinisediminis]